MELRHSLMGRLSEKSVEESDIGQSRLDHSYARERMITRTIMDLDHRSMDPRYTVPHSSGLSDIDFVPQLAKRMSSVTSVAELDRMLDDALNFLNSHVCLFLQCLFDVHVHVNSIAFLCLVRLFMTLNISDIDTAYWFAYKWPSIFGKAGCRAAYRIRSNIILISSFTQLQKGVNLAVSFFFFHYVWSSIPYHTFVHGPFIFFISRQRCQNVVQDHKNFWLTWNIWKFVNRENHRIFCWYWSSIFQTWL